MTPLPVKVPEHNLGIAKMKRELYIVVKSIVQFGGMSGYNMEILSVDHSGRVWRMSHPSHKLKTSFEDLIKSSHIIVATKHFVQLSIPFQWQSKAIAPLLHPFFIFI